MLCFSREQRMNYNTLTYNLSIFSLSPCYIVIIVRGLNPYLSLNCSNRSTSTKFGPLVAKVIYFRFFAGAKLGSRRGLHCGQIQDGRHSKQAHVITCKLRPVETHLIALFYDFGPCKIYLTRFKIYFKII